MSSQQVDVASEASLVLERARSSCCRITSSETKARNFSVNSGSRLLTAARYRRRPTCSHCLLGLQAARPCWAFSRPRGYVGTARPTYGQSRHRYCRCWCADLEFSLRNQRYSPLHPLSLRAPLALSLTGSIGKKCSVRSDD